MKKYKLLKPLPGIAEGYIFEQADKFGNIQFITSVDPISYPDFFQEIEEVSDEEWLANWINYQESVTSIEYESLPRFTALARSLIYKGIDVKMLREQKCPASTTVCQATECLCVKGVDGE